MVGINLMINIIYEDNHILVVEKPVNMPVQKDISGDLDLLTLLKKYIKDKYNKPGNVYLGLVHRLDRPVGGIMVFAKTSKAASRLSKQIHDKTFKKTYYAVVHGKTSESGKLDDYLLKDKKTNKVEINPLGKRALLTFNRLGYQDNFSLVKINLKTGRSHQIRVQFSHYGYPLYGDHKYGIERDKTTIALFAQKIEFDHPVKNQKVIFSLKLPNVYPYTLFNMDSK